MKRVLIAESNSTVVFLNDLQYDSSVSPIFAKKDGKLVGMIVNESKNAVDQWILRLGGATGANGFHSTIERCMLAAEKYGYEFFVDQ